jgi:DNA-binding transcriptional LysR family regulator
MLDGLKLDQLRMLAAVAETGSFSAAGRRLGRVQSAVSQSIQMLEQQLRLPLFDREAKTPQLTDAGRVILAMAHEVLARTEDLQARAAAMGAGVEPELAIAIDSVFPNGPLAESLRAVRERFPGLPVTLHTESIGGPERRLRDGQAQIGLFAFSLTACRELDGRRLIEIPVIPVASAQHPLARIAGPLTRSDLERHTQLILTDGMTGADAPSWGVISPHVWRFADLSRRLDFLLEGFGWGTMPRHLVEPLIGEQRLVHLDVVEPSLLISEIPIDAVHVRGKPPGQAGRWFLDDLERRVSSAICQERLAAPRAGR